MLLRSLHGLYDNLGRAVAQRSENAASVEPPHSVLADARFALVTRYPLPFGALQTARWRGPRQSGVEVCYALARGAAFGHGDEVWAAAIYLAERLCDPESRRALLPAQPTRARRL